MVALVSTVAYLGLEARAVEVQCQIAPGMPGFALVGLPDKAVGESRQRVSAALTAMGLALPPKRITINLSPADLPKEGSHYDLPIALSLLAAMGIVDSEQMADFVAVGELALDGRIIPSPGVLLAALHASERDLGLICPAAQGSEARWADGVPIIATPNLISLLNHLKGTQVLPPPQPGRADPPPRGPDLKQVKGAGSRPARAGNSCGRVAQPAHVRSARCRKVAACLLPARHPSRTHRRRGAGSLDDRLRRGHAGRWPDQPRAAVPRPASFRVDGGADGRRPESAAR